MSKIPDYISFSVDGLAPSKSNYRQSKDSKAQWARIKEYQKAVGEAAMVAGAKRRCGKYRVGISLVLSGHKIDTDAIFKVFLDGLKGVAMPDDNKEWVQSVSAHWEDDESGEPRVSCMIIYFPKS